jgi:hypothetical protein
MNGVVCRTRTFTSTGAHRWFSVIAGQTWLWPFPTPPHARVPTRGAPERDCIVCADVERDFDFGFASVVVAERGNQTTAACRSERF